jgi:hypothetical protein
MRFLSTGTTFFVIVFLIASTPIKCFKGNSVQRRLTPSLRYNSRLKSTPDGSSPSASKKQSQIATLNSMAAKLRAEAAELEVRF